MDWRLAHRRAFSDARHALRIETGERLVIALIIGVAYVVSVWWLLGQEVGEKQLLLKLIAVVVPAGIFPAVYLWKFAEKAHLNLYLLIAAILLVGAAIAFAGYLIDRSRGPLQWTWDTNSPVGFSMSSGGPLWADAFQIKGRNRWGDPITITKASIRSDITQETMQALA
jgi:hypothetical protein